MKANIKKLNQEILKKIADKEIKKNVYSTSSILAYQPDLRKYLGKK